MNDRRLLITAAVSLTLHGLAVAGVLLLLHTGAIPPEDPQKPAEVELVMEEHKGDARPVAAPSPAPQPVESKTQQTKSQPDQKPAETPPAQPAEAQPDAKEAAAQPPSPSDEPAREAEAPKPAPPTEQPTPSVAQPVAPAPAALAAEASPPAAEPAPPAAQAAPIVMLHGTDSPSEATAFGDHILPARPDAVFHNRPPEYPAEAAQNGEEGAVVLVVHISPSGRAAGVDVLSSSGYVLLDRAAMEAVSRWRFLPAVKDGEPVSSDMSMQFVFENK
jgi:periplasmic protein TonB